MKFLGSAVLAAALTAAIAAPASACPYAKDKSASMTEGGSNQTAQGTTNQSTRTN